MARRDLSELEIHELQRWAVGIAPPRQLDLIERLCAEVRELRNREAAARLFGGQEGEY